MTSSGNFSFGIRRFLSLWESATMSRLFFGSPGTMTGPDSPPAMRRSRVSSSRPPFGRFALDEWQE
jgi:hypothetical protein